MRSFLHTPQGRNRRAISNLRPLHRKWCSEGQEEVLTFGSQGNTLLPGRDLICEIRVNSRRWSWPQMFVLDNLRSTPWERRSSLGIYVWHGV